MITFRYLAIDAGGERQAGDVEASDIDDARRRLVERGWRVESLEPVSAIVQTGPISSEEATQLGVELAELVREQMPLPEGLRAISRELAPSRLSRSLEQISGELAKGRPLPEALAACGAAFPDHLRGLIAAGIRSGQLGEALQQFVALERHGQQMRREMWSVLAYPLVLLVMLSVLGVAIAQFLLPVYGAIFKEYRIEMPTIALVGQWVFGPGMCLAGGLVAVLLAIRFFGGRRVWHAIRRRVPLLGPLFYFQAVRDFAQLLAILLGEGVSLPEALRLTGRGVRDASSSAAADRLAVDVEQGGSFGDALAGRRARPLSSLGPIAHWGQEHNALPESLDTAAAMYAGRADLQLDLLRISLPPVVFLIIFVGGILLFSAFWTTALLFLRWISFSQDYPTSTSDLEKTVLIVIALVLVAALFGGLILVIVRFIFVRRRMGRDRLSYRVLNGMAWGSLALAVVVQWISGANSIPYLPLIVAAAVIIGMIIGQYRRCRREALLMMISTAVERQLPLGPVLAMFGSESIGWNDERGRVMAEWLEQGMPLDEALAAAGEPLGESAGVLVRMGRHVDDMRGALACLTRGFQQYQSLWRMAVSRLCYLVAVMAFMASVMATVMERILPSFEKIFHDFKMPLPGVTRLVIRLGDYGLEFDWLLLLPLLAIFFYIVRSYVGDARLDLFGLRRLLLPFHTSTIMQALSLSAERQQPLSPAIKLLAQTYPRRFVRRRLARVDARIDRGEDWLESLQAEGLARSVDVAVLRAGEHVGNLPWALRELAEGGMRRLAFRLQALENLLFPLLVLLIGAAVGVFVVGLFIPLTTLIESLAR